MRYKFDRELRVRCIDAFEKYYDVLITPEEADEILSDLADLYLVLSEDSVDNV